MKCRWGKNFKGYNSSLENYENTLPNSLHQKLNPILECLTSQKFRQTYSYTTLSILLIECTDTEMMIWCIIFTIKTIFQNLLCENICVLNKAIWWRKKGLCIDVWIVYASCPPSFKKNISNFFFLFLFHPKPR